MIETAAIYQPAGTGRVGLVIPTLNAGERWNRCVDAIHGQTLRPDRILVIDSSSTDGTRDLAEAAGFEVLKIERATFNHGGTRQRAADLLADCGIIIFLTQDAIPANSRTFEHIVRNFTDSAVAVAYGRQIPHVGALPIEAHARHYNYGQVSMKKDASCVPSIGSKVFFCSNSFAAYRRSALLQLGGFRGDLILGEDMEFAARAVEAGLANMYDARAVVFHSHHYSMVENFSRYFDIGVFDAGNDWMRKKFGSHRGEGFRFVKSELRYLKAEAPLSVPYAIMQTIGKLLGYRAGRLHRILPPWVNARLSMSPNFWRSTRPVAAG